MEHIYLNTITTNYKNNKSEMHRETKIWSQEANGDALNKQMGLNLTWHDVVWMYECHLFADSGYYLKSRSFIIRFVSCLSKSNKGMKDDFLIAFGEWHDGLHCLPREGEPHGVP